MTTGRIPSVDGGIQPTIIDAAGDLIYGASNDTPARLAIGTAGQVLTVNAGATAPEWAAAAGGGGLTLAQIATGSTTSGTQLQFTSLTSYDKLILHYYNMGWATSNANLQVRINNSSSSVYNMSYNWNDKVTSPLSLDQSFSRDTSATEFTLTRNGTIGLTSQFGTLTLVLENCLESGFTHVQYQLGANTSTGNTLIWGNGVFATAAAVSTLEIFNSNGNTFNSGDYTLWGG